MNAPSLSRAVAAYRSSSAVTRAAMHATLATVFFAAMTVLIRYISEELHVLQIVFFRNLLALVWLTPWMLRAGVAGMRTDKLPSYGLRAVVGLVGMTTGFAAVTLMPVTEATALSFTAPLFATVGAALLLGEVVRIRRWSAILIGFVGVMIVLRPGAEAIQLGAILALVNAAAMATNKLLTKTLARTEPTERIVTYMVLLLTPLSLVPALFVWEWPTWHALLWLTVLAGCGTAGHWFVTSAYAKADLSFVMPFDFARLPFTALFAFLLFAEIPTIWTWIGGAVIFASSFYIALREAHLARERRRAAAADRG